MENLRQEYQNLLESNSTQEVAYANWQVNKNQVTELELDQANEDFDRRLEEIDKSITRMKNLQLFTRLTAALKSHFKKA